MANLIPVGNFADTRLPANFPMTFKYLNIAARLRLAFGIVIVVLLAIVAVSFFGLRELHQNTDDLAAKTWPRVRAANLALDNVRGSFGRLAQLSVAVDPAELNTATERLAANTAAFNKALAELDATLVSDGPKATNAGSPSRRAWPCLPP